MDSQNIKGPQDYHKYDHKSTGGLIWLDGRWNSIPLSHKLGTHVEAIDPIDLWNSIQTRNKVGTVPAHRNGPSNITAIDPNIPPMTTPTSPIVEHQVDMSQSEATSMEMVKELLEDPMIQPGMMQSALNAITSLFTPSKTIQSAKKDSPENPDQVPTESTSSNTNMTDINRKLNTYKDRLALGFTNFKKHLETQSRVEVECVKQNLKTEFEHELRQKTLTHNRTIESLTQQINQLGEELQQ